MLFRQPQHGPLHIKRSDPITKGLRIALVGTSGLNIADGIMLTKIGTVDQAITPHGVAHQPLVNSVAGWQYDQEISGAVSIHAIIARAGDTTTDDANKVQAVISNNTSGQSTRWDFNLGNGFGPGADKNKPRFSTQAVGIGSIYYNGVLQSGNNPASVALSNNVFYGITAVEASGASASGSGKTNLFTLQNALSLNGYCPLILVWDRALNANEIGLIAANPWRVFVDYADTEALKSSGGGATVITGNTGTATTAGIASGISSATTIACTPGGATTAGIACALPIKIACNVGNATPSGIACSLPAVVQCNAGTATTVGITAQVDIAGQIVIGCNAGTATTTGVSANISSAFVLTCNAGTATTLGTTAYFPQSLQCNPGNAIALGIDATFTVAGPTTLVCNVGNATASGISFSFGGTLVDAPNGAGPAIIRPQTNRPLNVGGIRI